ncbi:dnaJ domain, Tetratricopeptide-like helical domain protein [Artemisia annua]|uniref:DnaJ domain, Tetratricopeptide-like helical domain protein n=1 Tax=Artemisia annua TaxID=35608 RepID=A0A2U1L1I3_ARTAN|nr:dnaJ domain, Tetratricopeptide-like helical domain protein [Artemisia annua]
MSGCFIDGLKKVTVCNPVMLLDVRGDPALALLKTSVTSEEGSQISGQKSVSNVATNDEAYEPYANEFCETESFKYAIENMEFSSDSFVTTLDNKNSIATSRRQESVFNFATSHLLHLHQVKVNLHIERNFHHALIGQQDYLKPVNEQIYKHETVTTSSGKVAEKACEKWRLRGIPAYSNGDLAKVEDSTRISLGRMKKALGDCLMAPNIDPVFLKAQVRAAHSYLPMGSIENTKKQYTKCLESGTDNTFDRKVIAEASEGLEKAQQIYEFNNDSLIFATPVEPSTLAVVPSEVNCLLTPIVRKLKEDWV